MLCFDGDELDAVLLQRIAHARADGAGQLAVAPADYLALAHAGDGVFHAVVNKGGKAALGVGDAAVQRLDEPLRILDAPQDKAVGHHGLFILRDYVRYRKIVQQHAVGHGLAGLDERQLPADAGHVADFYNAAKLPDDGIFVLLCNNAAGAQHGQRGDQHGGKQNAEDRFLFHISCPPRHGERRPS